MQCKKEVQSSEGGRPLFTICVPLRKDEKAMSTLWRCWFISLTAFFGVFFLCAHDVCADDRPNILVIWGDDVGMWNISHNNNGMMGYETPNIDRIAREGISFTDYYGQQSCTAGR